MSTVITYILTAVLLGISLFLNKKKTIKALMKAWKAFENILPQLLAVIMLVGILVTALNPETISNIIGLDSGWLGTALAAIVGSVTLIPGFIAFPTAELLLRNGAGYMQIGAFVSTLMMVGVVTFPVEKKFFGTKAALSRNIIAFFFSFIVAAVIQWVVQL